MISLDYFVFFESVSAFHLVQIIYEFCINFYGLIQFLNLGFLKLIKNRQNLKEKLKNLIELFECIVVVEFKYSLLSIIPLKIDLKFETIIFIIELIIFLIE